MKELAIQVKSFEQLLEKLPISVYNKPDLLRIIVRSAEGKTLLVGTVKKTLRYERVDQRDRVRRYYRRTGTIRIKWNDQPVDLTVVGSETESGMTYKDFMSAMEIRIRQVLRKQTTTSNHM